MKQGLCRSEHTMKSFQKMNAFVQRQLAFTAIACLSAQMSFGSSVLEFSRSAGTTVRTPSGTRITTVPFTVELWVNHSSLSTGEDYYILQDIVGHNARLFVKVMNGEPTLGVGAAAVRGSTRMNLNKWYHLAFVRDDAGTGYVYVNGALDKSGSVGTGALPASDIVMGFLTRIAGSGVNGRLADIRIWNTSRSQSQIATSMNRRLNGNESGLLYYWPLNEGTGSTVYSLATTATGTITSGTWVFDATLPCFGAEVEGSWIGTTDGNWSDTSKWLSGITASGAYSTAYFTNTPPTAISVTNDVAALKLGHLVVNGPAHTFTGNALTFTNEFVVPRLVTTAGVHAVETPLPLTAAGLSVESQTPEASPSAASSAALAASP